LPIIYVTHTINEVESRAERVVTMREGRIDGPNDTPQTP
jgi:ABC-type molybdate transport system ATPase subunit